MKVGYVRVSTEEQNTIRQEVLMRELGVVIEFFVALQQFANVPHRGYHILHGVAHRVHQVVFVVNRNI